MNDTNKVLVDTSLWIDFFRGDDSAKKTVDALIDNDCICCTGVVLAELLQGAKTEKEVKFLREFIHAFEFLEAGSGTWDKAGELSFRMRTKGHTVGLFDCFLAVLAVQYNVAMATRDAHFKALAKESGLTLFPESR